ncbi:hypothetical protein FHS18_004003 [Paenibacillus phyllosphaerae]|uniref:Copper amine oxidase-like N-terminal domain-containing protein n=1 Tax=Paenibacillus phyllosphaerae TaxID=274593 RepID=A0A7W5B027_9BACL|nr:hypothetical protein [Paenibacillus phyllosphaerae]MBB3111935.1 hypothetical protein [Paenibacillus phyllosphaerae]
MVVIRTKWMFILLAAVMIGGAVPLTVGKAAASAPVPDQPSTVATNPGKQLIPLLMNNYFVLFPGEKAPFIKSNRLMVPLQTFAKAIGAFVDERDGSKGTYYMIWPSGMAGLETSVTGLRAGFDWAVYGGDMGFGIGALPEYRAGELFIPVTPVLDGLDPYSYEMRRIRHYNYLAIMDPADALLLDEVKDDDIPHIDYPPMMSEAPYPLIPTALAQKVIQSGSGKQIYRMTMEMERADGIGERMEAIELQIIAVDQQGKATKLTQQRPPADGTVHTVVFDMPREPAYVLVQSTPIYKEEPAYKTGYELQAAMASAMAKVYNRRSLFEDLRLYPVAYTVDPYETRLSVTKPAWDRTPITAQEIDTLRHAVFEIAGRSFPLDIEPVKRRAEPDLAGTITMIEASGRIWISSTPSTADSADGESSTRRWQGTPEPYLFIHRNNSEEGMSPNELTIGMKVEAWINGPPKREGTVEQVRLFELVVQE